MHEIAPTLAFSIDRSYYDNWKDSSGKLYPNYPNTTDRMIKKSVLINGVNTEYLITPEVVKRAQAHFNCPDLVGLELEK